VKIFTITNKIKKGDKVVVKGDPKGLHCSHWIYPFATVKSKYPLVLVSEDNDMTWRTFKLKDIELYQEN